MSQRPSHRRKGVANERSDKQIGRLCFRTNHDVHNYQSDGEERVMFIPERQREALMRLTMCARDECMMCIYQPKDDRCKDIATTAMHILANALRVDDDAPQTERSE